MGFARYASILRIDGVIMSIQRRKAGWDAKLERYKIYLIGSVSDRCLLLSLQKGPRSRYQSHNSVEAQVMLLSRWYHV